MRYEIFANDIKSGNIFLEYYGIRAVESDGALCLEAGEISQNFDAVNELIGLMNEGNAQPAHFYDIIEDFLSL